jgi:hypothetical protein
MPQTLMLAELSGCGWWMQWNDASLMSIQIIRMNLHALGGYFAFWRRETVLILSAQFNCRRRCDIISHSRLFSSNSCSGNGGFVSTFTPSNSKTVNKNSV